MMKTGYSLLLAMMLCASASPLVAAETAQKNASEPTKITQTVQALEHRVSKLESDPKFSFEAQNNLIDRSYKVLTDRIASVETWVSNYAAILTFFFVVAGFVGFRNIGKWVKNKIQEQAKLEIDKMIEEKSVDGLIEEGVSQIVKQKLADFDAELDEIRRLKKLYEELPKYPSESFTKQEQEAISKVEQVAEEKSVDERTVEDWFAIGLKANQEGRAEDCYQAFIKAMHLEETAVSIANAAQAAKKAGYVSDAEVLFKRAIDADPNHVNILGGYAIFLKQQGHPADAEVMYKRMIEVDPKQAIAHANYAQMLLEQGRAEGEAVLRKALNLSSDVPDLRVELNFYRLAHFPDEGDEALAELKRLLPDGVRSKGWNLAPNVERAIKDGHPNPELLQALADVISKDAPLDGLDKFAEWKAA